MKAEEVQGILTATFESCDVQVESDGGHFNILIVGDFFKDLNRVKRQQEVYAALNEHIMSGELHAVNIKTYTVSEFSALQA